ncbi:hypothetical protein XU18_3809 [Perkinsela sp. CCAP 1560/4]|nr:hypothetical protein XU18_3809 [Perkinsela sp. CCAP 1560/4]|eukprot:KNH05081.1 hypothetical protein XU18_3809 [Perkinsela sp. CCAP 1560/4]
MDKIGLFVRLLPNCTLMLPSEDMKTTRESSRRSAKLPSFAQPQRVAQASLRNNRQTRSSGVRSGLQSAYSVFLPQKSMVEIFTSSTFQKRSFPSTAHTFFSCLND